jgi:hypothetical protein
MSALQFKQGRKRTTLFNAVHAIMQNLLISGKFLYINLTRETTHLVILIYNHDLFIYILAMKDKSINNLVAKYCFDVLTNVEQL